MVSSSDSTPPLVSTSTVLLATPTDSRDTSRQAGLEAVTGLYCSYQVLSRRPFSSVAASPSSLSSSQLSASATLLVTGRGRKERGGDGRRRKERSGDGRRGKGRGGKWEEHGESVCWSCPLQYSWTEGTDNSKHCLIHKSQQ